MAVCGYAILCCRSILLGAPIGIIFKVLRICSEPSLERKKALYSREPIRWVESVPCRIVLNYANRLTLVTLGLIQKVSLSTIITKRLFVGEMIWINYIAMWISRLCL